MELNCEWEDNIEPIPLSRPLFTIFVTRIIYGYKYTYLFSKCLRTLLNSSEMGSLFIFPLKTSPQYGTPRVGYGEGEGAGGGYYYATC